MNKELVRVIGSTGIDNLIAHIDPPAIAFGVTIRKLKEEKTLKRGTIMAKSSVDGKLVVLGTDAAEGETLTVNCVLTDDVEVGTETDKTATAYRQGCFNKDAVTVNDGYTITEADIDELRRYNILFADML